MGLYDIGLAPLHVNCALSGYLATAISYQNISMTAVSIALAKPLALSCCCCSAVRGSSKCSLYLLPNR